GCERALARERPGVRGDWASAVGRGRHERDAFARAWDRGGRFGRGQRGGGRWRWRRRRDGEGHVPARADVARCVALFCVDGVGPGTDAQGGRPDAALGRDGDGLERRLRADGGAGEHLDADRGAVARSGAGGSAHHLQGCARRAAVRGRGQGDLGRRGVDGEGHRFATWAGFQEFVGPLRLGGVRPWREGFGRARGPCGTFVPAGREHPNFVFSRDDEPFVDPHGHVVCFYYFPFDVPAEGGRRILDGAFVGGPVDRERGCGGRRAPDGAGGQYDNHDGCREHDTRTCAPQSAWLASRARPTRPPEAHAAHDDGHPIGLVAVPARQASKRSGSLPRRTTSRVYLPISPGLVIMISRTTPAARERWKRRNTTSDRGPLPAAAMWLWDLTGQLRPRQ